MDGLFRIANAEFTPKKRHNHVQVDDRLLLLALDTLLAGGNIEPGIDPTPAALIDAGLAMEMGRKLRLTPLGLQVRLDLKAKAEAELQEDRYRRPVTRI